MHHATKVGDAVCCGSTELPIVVARRSWSEISCRTTGHRNRTMKNSLNYVSTCLKIVDHAPRFVVRGGIRLVLLLARFCQKQTLGGRHPPAASPETLRMKFGGRVFASRNPTLATCCQGIAKFQRVSKIWSMLDHSTVRARVEHGSRTPPFFNSCVIL